MSTNKMRPELIDKIKSIEDENILQEVYRILEIGTYKIESIALSEKQKKSIEKGLEDMSSGSYFSNRQADSEIEQRLKK